MKRYTISEHDLAQLRHAYAQLVARAVLDQMTFAKGLLAPIIRNVEKS